MTNPDSPHLLSLWASMKHSLYHNRFINLLAILLVVLAWVAAMVSACTLNQPASPVHQIELRDAPGGWYSVYFTDPSSPKAGSYRGGPDEALAKAIDEARLSVDVAVHQLNLWSIRNALLAADRRGVTVRMVVESDYLDGSEIQELKEAGIPVLGDRRESLMHNKFVVIDRVEVWTGSMNLTTSDSYRNNNNLVRIRSPLIAENYTTEFDEMFVDDLFGSNIHAETPHPLMTVEGTAVEVYFSPDDGTAEKIIRLLNDAQESIYFLAYSFTSDDIGAVMLERARDGITVAGVFETSQVKSNMSSEYDRLAEAGLDVRLDGNQRNMHHKVIIIDGTTVITGSYNFSARAEMRNDENTIVIHDARFADLYLSEYERVFEEAHKNP